MVDFNQSEAQVEKQFIDLFNSCDSDSPSFIPPKMITSEMKPSFSREFSRKLG